MDKIDRRIPVISDPAELNIAWRTLQTIIAGRSLIDTFGLNINSLDEAHKFLDAYGVQTGEDSERLLSAALEYIDTVLINDTDLSLPEEMYDLSVPELMLEASAINRSAVSEWSCLILKVCHAVAHAQWTRDEGAFNAALIKINERLKPYIIESEDGLWIGDDDCRIPVVECSIKTRKKFFRIVTKLLLKEGNLSAAIYDHIGVRIVTNDIFSAILLIKVLRRRQVFVYANVIPQESKNSMAEFDQIEELFSEFSAPVEYREKGEIKRAGSANENPYSSKEFKMIKIIERVLVTTSSGRRVFFPCEFQFLTRQTNLSLSKKQTHHSTYERRQIKGVRKRLLNRTSFIGWNENGAAD